MTDAVKPASLSDILGSATRVQRTATVCVAGHLNDEYAALERRLVQLAEQSRGSDSLGDPLDDEKRAVAEQMEKVREQMRTHEHAFTFEALHPKAWSDLTAAHPPRPEVYEPFNKETFPLAACVATLILVNGADPGPGAEALFVEIWTDKLNEGQRGDLFDACWAANAGTISVPFSELASAVLHNTAEK